VVEVEGPADRWLSSVDVTAEASGGTLTIALADIAEVPDVVARLASEGARIVRVAPDVRSLEDVYLELVGAAP
jgi:hypothetical protein